MKILKLTLLVAIVAAMFSSCELDEICVKGEGPTISKELSLPPFHSILLDISADVFITQGEAQSVVIEGEENIIDLLELDVRNDTWDIDFDQTCVRKHNDLKIYITIPEIRNIEIDGSGDVVGENLFEGESIDLLIDGSGNMDLALDMKEVSARVEGSGDYKLEGLAEKVRYVIRGSGDIRAFELEALDADVEVRGSGAVEVNVIDFLKVDIDGSGDVFYKGNPELDVRVDGSGQVKDAN